MDQIVAYEADRLDTVVWLKDNFGIDPDEDSPSRTVEALTGYWIDRVYADFPGRERASNVEIVDFLNDHAVYYHGIRLDGSFFAGLSCARRSNEILWTMALVAIVNFTLEDILCMKTSVSVPQLQKLSLHSNDVIAASLNTKPLAVRLATDRRGCVSANVRVL